VSGVELAVAFAFLVFVAFLLLLSEKEAFSVLLIESVLVFVSDAVSESVVSLLFCFVVSSDSPFSVSCLFSLPSFSSFSFSALSAFSFVSSFASLSFSSVVFADVLSDLGLSFLVVFVFVFPLSGVSFLLFCFVFPVISLTFCFMGVPFWEVASNVANESYLECSSFWSCFFSVTVVMVAVMVVGVKFGLVMLINFVGFLSLFAPG
jgi:hypothetical protein